jgi:hypothetical protein
MPKDNLFGRRKVVKAIGAGVSLAGLSGLATAQEESDTKEELFDKSFELWEKNDWDVSQWVDHLNSQGIPTESSSTTMTIDRDTKEGGISPDAFDKNDVEFSITKSTVTSGGEFAYEYVHFDWEHSAGDYLEYGEGPYDHGAISFHDDHYDRSYHNPEWVRYETTCGDVPGMDSKNPNAGAVCQFGDGSIANYSTSGGLGLELNPKDGVSKGLY